MRYIKKNKGKCACLKIDSKVQKEVREFKTRLNDMVKYDEVSDKNKIVINVILHKIDDYDLNLLIGYYDIANENKSELARLFQISNSVVTGRIKKIINKIKEEVSLLEQSEDKYKTK